MSDKRPDGRPLTPGEQALVRSIYGEAIDLEPVRIRRRKWWPFQPNGTVMAPRGHVHFHPNDAGYSEDFSLEGFSARGLLIHELCHVWQHQQGICLPLARHPFCRYTYDFDPGRSFTRYGIEQQAEIVRHAFLLQEGVVVPGKPLLAAYRAILPFTPLR